MLKNKKMHLSILEFACLCTVLAASEWTLGYLAGHECSATKYEKKYCEEIDKIYKISNASVELGKIAVRLDEIRSKQESEKESK